MRRIKRVLVAWLALAALTLPNVAGLAPASADGRLPGERRATADSSSVDATGIFPASRDASCGTLLRGGVDWPPPARQAAWLYRCVDTPDLWPYVALDAGRYRVARSFVSFNTSSIPASASVVSATISLSPRLVMLTDPGGTTLEIVSASQGIGLEADDYDTVSSTSLASKPLSGLLPDKANSLPLNPNAFGSINKGGITQIGLRLGMDLLNQPPQPPADATFGGAQVVISLEGLELMVTYQDASGTAPGPALARVEPDLVGSNAVSPRSSPLVTLGGSDFSSGAVAYLSRVGLSYPLVDVRVNGPTSVVGRLPGDLPVGVYDIFVANPDGGWAMLPGGFIVISGSGPLVFRYYFPFLLDGTVREGESLDSIH